MLHSKSRGCLLHLFCRAACCTGCLPFQCPSKFRTSLLLSALPPRHAQSPFVHVDTADLDGGHDSKNDQEAGEEGVDRRQLEREKEAKREHAKQVMSAHAVFRCSNSDALGALRALCGYEAAEAGQEGGGSAFCASHHLHLRNLRCACVCECSLAGVCVYLSMSMYMLARTYCLRNFRCVCECS